MQKKSGICGNIKSSFVSWPRTPLEVTRFSGFHCRHLRACKQIALPFSFVLSWKITRNKPQRIQEAGLYIARCYQMNITICTISFDIGSTALAVSMSVQLTLMFHFYYHYYWLLVPDLTGQTKMQEFHLIACPYLHSPLCVSKHKNYFRENSQVPKSSWFLRKYFLPSLNFFGDKRKSPKLTSAPSSCGPKVHSSSNYSFSTKAPIATKDCWAKQRAASFWIGGTDWRKSSSQEFILLLHRSNKYTDPTYYFSLSGL